MTREGSASDDELAAGWVELQIRAGVENGLLDNLPGRGKPLEGIDSGHRDEDWWLKAKLRAERLSYLPTTLAVRKELEEARDAIANARSESTVRRIVAEINERIRSVNRRGADGPPSTVMPLDEETVVQKWRDENGR